jgi:hypothetical protein
VTNNPIAEILGAPLGADWTVDGLAEHLLSAIAAAPADESCAYHLEMGASADCQPRRLLRPLLACLAAKSAAENGTPVNLYGGPLTFKRPGPTGVVWILGHFDNRPGSVHVTLRPTVQKTSP